MALPGRDGEASWAQGPKGRVHLEGLGLKGKRMHLSVIITVFNEAGNIGAVIRQVRSVIGPQNELIVVDDGSTDDTVKELDPDVCTILRHEFNRGKGEAIRTGVRAAQGDVIAFMDGDGQDDPGEIWNVVDGIKNGADFAIGSRFVVEPGSNGDHRNPALRYSSAAVGSFNEFGNKGLSGLLNLLFGTKITDTQASLKCFRADKLRAMKLESSRYEIETEMIIRAARAGLKIVEVPVHRYPRGQGKSKLYEIPLGRVRFAVQSLLTATKGYLFWR